MSDFHGNSLLVVENVRLGDAVVAQELVDMRQHLTIPRSEDALLAMSTRLQRFFLSLDLLDL